MKGSLSDFCLCLRTSLQPFPTCLALPLPPIFVERQGAVTACGSMELLAVAASWHTATSGAQMCVCMH